MSKNLSNIAFVDIETTGSSSSADRIVEIAIICVKDNKIEKEYSTLVNPEMPFSPFIEMITGIKQSDIENAPTFEEIQRDVFNLLEDRLFIAHNVSFDYGFIKQEYRRLGLTFAADRCCTVRLSRHLFPEHKKHNLDSIIERFGFTCENRHRAYSDTSVLWQFYQHLWKNIPEEKLLEAFQIISKQPGLPPHLDKSYMDMLTENPGVYTFYGEQGLPLYIGKSKNVKDRVLSHFSLIHESQKERELFEQVKKIEVTQTAGEFGALLLESSLVKENKPIYNRQLRNYEDLIFTIKDTNPLGYNLPVIKSVSAKGSTDLKNIIAVHKTKPQAKKYLAELADEYQLCRVMMGLEKPSSGCFNHKIGKCTGVCLNKEDSIDYNLRFSEAFAKTTIKDWPFEGIIMVEENDMENRGGERYIFDNWCFLGSVKFTDETVSFSATTNEGFDYDMYTILRRYLKNSPKLKRLTKKQFEKIKEGEFT